MLHLAAQKFNYMKILPVYRVLTYILLPFGAYFGLQALTAMIQVFGNPIFMLFTFIFACVPIYIFCSFIFLQKGIKNAQPCKKSLRDWIRANAVVTIIYVFLGLLAVIGMLMFVSDPELFKQALAKFSADQKTAVPAEITDPRSIQTIKYMAGIMLALSIVLLVHVILTFRMLKLYKHVFQVE